MEDGHLQVGYFRSGTASLLRYWVDYGYGEEYEAAVAMLEERGRKIPDESDRADAFVFDDSVQELFFKLRFSDSFMGHESYPWTYYDNDYDYDYDYEETHWEWDAEPVHDRFFIPAKVKTYYGLGFD